MVLKDEWACLPLHMFAGAEMDFNRVILAVPKSGFKERRRPSSAAEIAAVSVRDNLFWVRPPSRQV